MKEPDIAEIRESLREEIRDLSGFVKELRKKISGEESTNRSLMEERNRLETEFETSKKKLLSVEHEMMKKLDRIKYFEDMRDHLVQVDRMIAKGRADFLNAENLLKSLLNEEAELRKEKKYLIDMINKNGIQI